MNQSNRLTDVLGGAGRGAVELAFYFPWLLLISAYMLPNAAVLWWLGSLVIVYASPYLVFGGKRSVSLFQQLLLCAALGVLHTASVLASVGLGITLVQLAACGAAGAFMCWRGCASMLNGWTSSFHATHMFIGIISYIVLQMLIFFALQSLSGYGFMLTACGIAAVLLFLFLSNERHLAQETSHTGKSASVSASRRQNRLLMLLLVAIMAAVAAFRQLPERIEPMLSELLARLLALFDSEEKPFQEERPTEQAPMEFLPAEPKEPSRIMQLIELILQIAVTVLVVAGLIWLAYFAGKKLYQVIKALYARLVERRAMGGTGEEEYTDEIEQLMNFSKWRDRMKLRLTRGEGGLQDKRWGDLATNADRMRYLYIQLVKAGVKRGYAPKSHLTPRETVLELLRSDRITGLDEREMADFAEAYEDARYGGKQPEEGRIEKFRGKL